jgi:hypothetical protein
MVRSWCERVKSWYGVDVTALSHGTELMQFSMYMRLVGFRKVTLCVHCTLYSKIHLADFMLIFVRKNPQIQLTESNKSA